MPPPGGMHGGGAGVSAAVDPVRLLKQYKIPLAISMVIGVVVGVSAHFVIKRFWPQYRSTVTYQALPPYVGLTVTNNAYSDEAELDRYMLTQSRIMVSERVLRDAVRDPALKTQGVRWIQPFIRENNQVDQSLAARDLKEIVGARSITGTNLIELAVSAREPKDAAVLVNAVHDAYWRDLEQQVGANTADRRNALNKALTDARAEITRLEEQRNKILRDNNISARDAGNTQEKRLLELLSPQLIELDKSREAFMDRQAKMEEQLKSETGPVFDDAMREEADRDPLVSNIRSEISSIKTAMDALKAQGLGDSHRTIQDLTNRMAAKEAELAAKKNEALKKAFESELERLRQRVESVKAQRKELQQQYDGANRKVMDLVRAMADYDSLGAQVTILRDKEGETRAALENLQGLVELRSTDRIDRIRRLEPGRVPDDVAFPRLSIMLAAGFFLVVGLTGAAIVLREVLDQRIKGPSDIALIPRLRLLGVVPTIEDDPSKPAAAETAFKDCASGALAEAFRQMRPSIVKRLQQGGHRSLLLVGTMPGSGTTTVAANLGMACAAADQRVLLIDANFRRPGLQKAFKLAEGPGLGEVLSRKSTLEAAVQQTSVENLHLLSAGSPQSRAVPERLTTETMTALIREATDRYDLVIVDTAPAMVAGDCLALANRCDAVALVVRALHEKRGLIARIRDQLGDARAEFLGVVVNAVRASAGGYMRRNIRESFEYQNNGNVHG
ncbi:MAG: polysaccharide biosynthesis tyrosine autokinase [Phycisphaerales bacterium]